MPHSFGKMQIMIVRKIKTIITINNDTFTTVKNFHDSFSISNNDTTKVICIYNPVSRCGGLLQLEWCNNKNIFANPKRPFHIDFHKLRSVSILL